MVDVRGVGDGAQRAARVDEVQPHPVGVAAGEVLDGPAQDGRAAGRVVAVDQQVGAGGEQVEVDGCEPVLLDAEQEPAAGA